MEDGKKMVKEFFLELGRFAGAIVVAGLCMWLVVYGVIFLAHTPARDTKGKPWLRAGLTPHG